MSLPDLGKLLSGAREMQARLAELQRDLAGRRIEGGSGGGMVKAVVNGQQRVLAIEIEPELLASGDRAMIQDLCAAAVNAALENAQRVAQEELGKLTGGLGLPMPGGLGGLGALDPFGGGGEGGGGGSGGGSAGA